MGGSADPEPFASTLNNGSGQRLPHQTRNACGGTPDAQRPSRLGGDDINAKPASGCVESSVGAGRGGAGLPERTRVNSAT